MAKHNHSNTQITSHSLELTEEEREHAAEILLQEKQRQAAIIAMQQEIALMRHDLDTVMQMIITQCQKLTQAQGSVVELIEGDDVVYRAASGEASAHLGLRLKRNDSFSGLCIQLNRVLICHDSEQDDRVDKIACRAVGVRSMIVAPLLHDGQTIGVVKVYSSEPNRFTAWDVTTLQILSGIISVVLRDASTLASLQESENRFRDLVDNLPIIIWITNPEGKLTFANRYWTEFTGCPIEELYSLRAIEGIHPDDRESLMDFWREVIASRQPYHSEYRRLHRDGQFHWMNAYAIPRFLPNGDFAGYIGFSIDIHQEKLLQSQLLEAQKMESLGRLAGGIAHDFNNLLTAIIGYTELAATSLPAHAEQQRFLKNVLVASERATELTKQLLMYARRQMVEFRNVDLNTIVQNLLPILQQTIGEQYEVVAQLSNEECSIFSNSSQIEQVLMNLVVNARDAMPEGGRILLETSNVFLDEDYVATHFNVTPGEYVMLSVSDTGIGMTSEILDHIFEPFFTTKEVGKGTGLGLATCYGIIKQNKGNIWVYSEVGRGTTFKVYLPRIYHADTVPVSPSESILSSHTATILLVDDEQMVRELAARILREHGYQVLEARNGADALQIQSEWKDTIDLLITDVVMPLMGGRELEERIQRLRPQIKTLYISGYTQNVIVQEGVLKPNVTLLTKPFTATGLLQKVHEALSSA